MVHVNKLLTLLFLGMFFISFTTATLGRVEQGKCIQLYQYCDDCTYVNLTQIQYPDESIERINQPMERNDIDYNYTWCNTYNLGKHYYTVKGDKGGTTLAERLSFEVTPSGQGGNSYIVFSTFIIILIYLFTFLSFFYARNIPLTVLGGMAMIFLGIYIINNGIIIFRDSLTNYISYITIGTGFLLSIWALFEQFSETYN